LLRLMGKGAIGFYFSNTDLKLKASKPVRRRSVRSLPRSMTYGLRPALAATSDLDKEEWTLELGMHNYRKLEREALPRAKPNPSKPVKRRSDKSIFLYTRKEVPSSVTASLVVRACPKNIAIVNTLGRVVRNSASNKPVPKKAGVSLPFSTPARRSVRRRVNKLVGPMVKRIKNPVKVTGKPLKPLSRYPPFDAILKRVEYIDAGGDPAVDEHYVTKCQANGHAHHPQCEFNNSRKRLPVVGGDGVIERDRFGQPYMVENPGPPLWDPRCPVSVRAERNAFFEARDEREKARGGYKRHGRNAKERRTNWLKDRVLSRLPKKIDKAVVSKRTRRVAISRWMGSGSGCHSAIIARFMKSEEAPHVSVFRARFGSSRRTVTHSISKPHSLRSSLRL
jgi:hypothetical protein